MSNLQAQAKAIRRRRRWSFLLGLVVLVSTLATPPPGDLALPAWRLLGVALLMAIWWIGETIPIAATALLPMVLFPTLGILSSRDTAHEYGNHLIFLFFGGFMIAIAMERWGLHRRLALALIDTVGTRPRRLILGFMLASAFLSMWISNTATALMILPIAMAAARQLTETATWSDRTSSSVTDGIVAREAALESFGGCLMLAVAYGASAGGIATLVGTPPNIVLAGAYHELFPDFPELGFGRWMLLGLPTSVAVLVVAHRVVLWLGPTVPWRCFDFGPATTDVIASERAQLPPMNRGERWVLGGFVLAVLLWFTREDLTFGVATLPGWARLFPESAFVHDATVAMAIGLVFMLLRAPRANDLGSPDSGEPSWVPVLDWDSVQRKTPWGILLLFGGGFALAAGFQHTGLATWMGERLQGLGGLPGPVVILVICLSTTFLTEVTSNTATSTMLMPILGATAVAIDTAPLLLMAPAAISASCAFMLPVATPPNAIVFGSGWLTIPRMARVGLVLNLACALVITLLSWLWLPLVFG